nr:amidohydrolase family protein [Rhodoferax sp.]
MEILDPGKRRSLRNLVNFSAFGLLTGCCSLMPYAESKVKGGLPDLSAFRPWLRPSQIRRSPAKKVQFALDAHGHFFNGTDVNVKGYVEKCMAHEIPNAALRKFVEHLGGVAQALANTLAPTADKEFSDLIELSKKYSSLQLAAAMEDIDKSIASNDWKIANAVNDELKRRGLDQEYVALQSEHKLAVRAEFNLVDSKSVPTNLTPEAVLRAIDPKTRAEDYFKLYGTHQRPLNSSDPGGFFEFLSHMLSPRWHNLRKYIKYYSEEADAFGIDAVFGSLVDFDFWLDCRPPSSRRDQMLLHSLLSALSGGYMLPLISYNPWTDIELKDSPSLTLAKEAIVSFGFIGVKIYPPVGYYPADNAILQNATTEKRPNLIELDRHLLEMFEWCANNGAPVMAHANRSMGRDAVSDEFGGPVGWQRLIAKFNGSIQTKYKLTINAGHFGGQVEGDLAPKIDIKQTWPVRFAAFSHEYPNVRFYGDIGKWDELLDCTKPKSRCPTTFARLNAAIAENVKKPVETTERIMYGTDWFMLSSDNGWQNYPEMVSKNLEIGLGPAMNFDRFFYTNAMECFGLGVGGAQRERMVNRLKGMPGGVPAWLGAS